MTVQTYLAMHSGLEEDTTDESENSLLVEYLSSLLHLLSLACQFLTKILQKTKTINEELSFSVQAL